MGEKIILEQENLPFETDEELGGLFFTGLSMSEAILEAGQTYQIEWDGQIYTCVASQMQFGDTLGVGLGNPAILGLGDDTGFTFLIGTDSEGKWLMVTAETASQHTVKIYQLVEDQQPETPEEEPEDTDGIVLYNRLNQPVVYGSYKKLLINRADRTQTIFSQGDAVAQTVDTLDFKNGDIVVKPEKDKLFSQLTITKPATLIAENIKKDVVVAGIKGTAEGNKPPVLNMEKTTLPFVYDEGWGKWVYTGDGVTYIVPQARYVVEYNGDTFVCKAVWAENINNGCAILGNASIFGMENTGEPFVLLNTPEGEMVVIAMETPAQSQIPVAVQMVSSSQLMLNDATLQFTLLNKNGTTAFANVDNDLVGLIPNLSYTVIWDGTAYPCTAMGVPDTDMVLMGKLPDFGLNPDYPFILMQEAGVVAIISTKDMESTHTVSVIPQIDTVVEGLEIPLDFSSGNQVIDAGDGYVVKSATLLKPENLIPENIANGVNIAGVIGALAGGGGDIKAVSKTFSAISSAQTLTHGLGKVPDIIIAGTNTYSTGTLVYMVGFSGAMMTKFNLSTQMVANSAGSLVKLALGSGIESTGAYGLSHATENTFKVGNIYNFPNNSSCWYIAIAGLT